MRCRAVPAEARTALDPEALRALVAEIARFYVSDKALRRAQRRMADLLSRGGDLPEKAVRAYLAEVRRYFEAFEREAHAHLGDVDRRRRVRAQHDDARDHFRARIEVCRADRERAFHLHA